MEAWVGCALWATRLDMVGNAHPTKALSHGISMGMLSHSLFAHLIPP